MEQEDLDYTGAHKATWELRSSFHRRLLRSPKGSGMELGDCGGMSCRGWKRGSVGVVHLKAGRGELANEIEESTIHASECGPRVILQICLKTSSLTCRNGHGACST